MYLNTVRQAGISFKRSRLLIITILLTSLSVFVVIKKVDSNSAEYLNSSKKDRVPMLFAVPKSQQNPRVVNNKVGERQFYQMKEKVEQEGTIKLIVRLNVNFNIKNLDVGSSRSLLEQSSIRRVKERLINELNGYDPASLKSYDYLPYIALRVNSIGLESIRSSDDILSIEEDLLSPPTLERSIPLIGGDKAWALGYTGKGQTIAILDTGIDKNHPFLAGKVVSEACYSSSCPGGVSSTEINSGLPCNIQGQCDHGTHVAGIAAGKGADFSGVAKDASIISINIFSVIDDKNYCSKINRPTPCISAYNSDILLALERVYALRQIYNIPAVNLSLGSGKYSSECDSQFSSMADAISLLRNSGIATIVSSGNNGYKDGINMPACISSAISVGSSTNNSDEKVSVFSNSSHMLSMLAPGELIVSAIQGQRLFGMMQGTSLAAPHITGTFAIIRQKSSAISVEESLSVLKRSGKNIIDSLSGIAKPRVSIDAALALITSPPPIQTIPSPPRNLVARSVSTSQIDLNWIDTSNNENGFKILRRLGQNGNWETIAFVPSNVINYQDSSLQPATIYYYIVKSYNDAGESSTVNIASATTHNNLINTQNLLKNGSFEEDNPGLGLTQLSSWRVVSGNVDVIPNNQAVLWAWHQSADGSKSLELSGNPGTGSVEQQFSTEIGRKYILSGWVAHHFALQAAEVGITVNGASLLPIRHSGQASQSDMKWERFIREFVASSSTTVIRLTDMNLAGWPWGGAVIDGLSVVQSTEPVELSSNADFIEQSVPATMMPGERAFVTVTMKNTGSNKWTAAGGYKLGTQNPQDNTTWGFGTRVNLLPTETVNSGSTKIFRFEIKAPETPGDYYFEMKMVKEGVEWFGQSTKPALIKVQNQQISGVSDAQFITHTLPNRISAGQIITASVTMKNIGTNYWSSTSGYSLGIHSPENTELVGLGKVVQLFPGEIIAPGKEKVFIFQIKTPVTAGTHYFQMQMKKEENGWFGQPTPYIQVDIQPEQNGLTGAEFVSQNIPTTILPGQVVKASVTMKNTGLTVWASLSGFSLGNPNQNSGMFALPANLNLAEGEIIGSGQMKKFEFQLLAPQVPGIYNIKFQMYQNGRGWFGEQTKNVQIVVPVSTNQSIDADFVIQSIPTVITPGQVVNASITLRNTGTIVWSSLSGFYLGMPNTQSDNLWGFGNKINLAQGEIIGPGQEKKFSFQMRAPYQPGIYNMQMQMYRDGYGWFGKATYNVRVIVPIITSTTSNDAADANELKMSENVFPVMQQIGLYYPKLKGGRMGCSAGLHCQ